MTRTGRTGLSLIETLIAIAMLAVFSGAIFGFLFNVIDHRERLWEGARRGAAWSRFLDMLDGDVLSTFARDVRDGAGVVGDASSLTIRSRRVWIDGAEAGGERTFADIETARYVFDAGEGVLLVGRGARGEAGDLVPLARGVRHVRFRYFDGEAWSDSFDSGSSGSLPSAIAVAVWFGERGQAGGAPLPPAGEGERAPAGAPGEEAAEDLPFGARESVDPNAAGFESMVSDPLEGAEPEEPDAEPDIVRLFAIADGPRAAWSGGS